MRRHPITALDVLHLATVGDKVQRFIKESIPKVVANLRKNYPGKDDQAIVRDILTQGGWRYSRSQDRWIHPELEAEGKPYSAPATLDDIGRMVATDIAQKALRSA